MRLRDFLYSAVSRRCESSALRQLRRDVQEAKALAARSFVQQLDGQGVLPRLIDAECQVYSQFGDDGIIQYLIRRLEVQPRTFVEFGVEDYSEANTRFLLVNDNWRGLIMDGSAKHVRAIQRDSLYWRHDLTAARAFIDRDNINDLIQENGFSGELGILSIDIDGNDYWVWDRIDCVNPVIVIAEYNSVFGSRRAVSIPYDPSFDRAQAHYSNLYWGCSLGALCVLAQRKGYALVGCNSAGNNAYFVRRDRLAPLRELTVEEGYVESRFRESRDQRGNLTYLAGPDRLRAIAEMPVVDVESGETIRIADVEGASRDPALDRRETNSAA